MSLSAQDVDEVAAGQRFESRRCGTNVVVLDPGSATEPPNCGGEPMRPGALITCGEPDRPGPEAIQAIAGFVYWDQVSGMKLRCTRSGSGLLSAQGREMVPYPASYGALNSAMR
jgi:hypothetical protein